MVFQDLAEARDSTGPERRPRPMAGIGVPGWLVCCSPPSTESDLVAKRCLTRTRSLPVVVRCAPAYLFKIATASLLPVHHVVKNRDHDIPEVRLGDQGHF